MESLTPEGSPQINYLRPENTFTIRHFLLKMPDTPNDRIVQLGKMGKTNSQCSPRDALGRLRSRRHFFRRRGRNARRDTTQDLVEHQGKLLRGSALRSRFVHTVIFPFAISQTKPHSPVLRF